METHQFEVRKVFDPILRFLHAWNALAIVCLIGTAWASEIFEKGPGEKTIWILHILIGYALIFGVSFRVVWGLVGPEHARLKQMWHPKFWITKFRNLRLKYKSHTTSIKSFGHDPIASLAYIAVYLVVIGMIVSGLMLAAIEHGMGPFAERFFDQVNLKHTFKEPHEIGSLFLIGFIVLHIGAIIWHERRDKTPIAQSMISGYQYRRHEKLKFWLVIGSWGLAGLGSNAFATTPTELQKGYAVAAKTENPAFKAFSKENGNTFFHLERTHSDGKKVSCATCHTADPRKTGLSRANKEIEPLAPSVNPKRFTDQNQVEKWFRRNCMDVLERPCTAQEKGHFIEYLKSL